MNYMDFYNACECRANRGLEELKKYVDSRNELIYTEFKEEENVSGIISIEVKFWANKDESITDVLGVWEFDSHGRRIE